MLESKTKNIVHIPDIDSTNREMLRRIDANTLFFNNLQDVYMLYADHQSGGRGQGTNRWESERAMNLLTTLYFRLSLPAVQQFAFNQFFAVATQQFLSHFVPNVMIKWPNDLYVADQKLAGILIEHAVCGDALRYSIAGIGINVNQIHFSAALPNPTSLSLLTSQQYDIHHFALLYYQFMQSAFLQFRTHADAHAWQQSYLSALYRRNEWHTYRIRGEQRYASIIGIDAYGRLQLIDTQNNIITCEVKEIIYL